MMLVIYTAHAGLEVLCRVAGVLLPLLIAFILLETLFLMASGSLRAEYLMPVFGEGFQRVAENIWPIGVMQSYGESIEMAVFWCLLNKRGHLGRISVGATLFAGLFIVLFDVLSITALGDHLFQEMMLPAFTTLKLASIAGFLENLDALGSLYFICTAFIKISVHVLAAALCIRELTFAGKNNAAIWISASSAYVVGMTMASNFSEHLHVGIKIIPNILLVPMFVVLPGLVFLLSLFGKAKKTGAEQ
jgi:spore germination protein KB